MTNKMLSIIIHTWHDVIIINMGTDKYWTIIYSYVSIYLIVFFCVFWEVAWE